MNLVLSGPGRGVVRFKGVGLHTGETSVLTVVKRGPGHGLVVARGDLPGAPRVRICADDAQCHRLSTQITLGGHAFASTIEHLMAALSGCGVWDADILLSGPEIPILDGSSLPFATALTQAGFGGSPVPRPIQLIHGPVRVETSGGWIVAEPSEQPLSLDVSIEFQGLGYLRGVFGGGEAGVFRAVADARTFAFERDLHMIRSRGLAGGGSLENAVVLNAAGQPLNPEGFRGKHEPLRHKALDLLGAPLMARVTAFRPGHHLSNLLARAIAQPNLLPDMQRQVM